MFERHIEHQFIESAELKLQMAPQLSRPIADAASLIFDTITSGRKILVCGNGGSASDALHFAAELTGRFERDRPGLSAISLAADCAALTAIGNDFGFEQVFARQVQALGQKGDVLVALSTSGNSPNVLAAIQAAHERDMIVIALTGATSNRSGGQVPALLGAQDMHLHVAHERTARVQEVHILILHCLCDAVDALLLGTDEGENALPSPFDV